MRILKQRHASSHQQASSSSLSASPSVVAPPKSNYARPPKASTSAAPALASSFAPITRVNLASLGSFLKPKTLSPSPTVEKSIDGIECPGDEKDDGIPAQVVSYLGLARKTRHLKPPQGYISRDTLEQAFRWIEDSLRDHMAEDIRICQLVMGVKAHSESQREAAFRQKNTRIYTLQGVTEEEDNWCLNHVLDAAHNAGDFSWHEIFWVKQMRRLRCHRLASNVVYEKVYILQVIDNVQAFATRLAYTTTLDECSHAKSVIDLQWDGRLWAQLEDRRLEIAEEERRKAAQQLEQARLRKEARLEAKRSAAGSSAEQPPAKKRRTKQQA